VAAATTRGGAAGRPDCSRGSVGTSSGATNRLLQCFGVASTVESLFRFRVAPWLDPAGEISELEATKRGCGSSTRTFVEVEARPRSGRLLEATCSTSRQKSVPRGWNRRDTITLVSFSVAKPSQRARTAVFVARAMVLVGPTKPVEVEREDIAQIGCVGSCAPRALNLRGWTNTALICFCCSRRISE
jgi:hypothetical protein